MSAFPHEAESRALQQEAQAAIDLVGEFADWDPNETSADNPWQNPSQIYSKLDAARSRVLEAAEKLKEAVVKSEEVEKAKFDEDFLRAQFMDMITDSFADVLTSMTGPDVDVDVLADCLQSGMDLLTEEDKEYFLQDVTDKEMNGDDADEMTPHQRRQMELGLITSPGSG